MGRVLRWRQAERNSGVVRSFCSGAVAGFATWVSTPDLLMGLPLSRRGVVASASSCNSPLIRWIHRKCSGGLVFEVSDESVNESLRFSRWRKATSLFCGFILLLSGTAGPAGCTASGGNSKFWQEPLRQH